MTGPIKAVIFDLDNTLYDEREYYLGAFRDISKYLSQRYDVREPDCYNALVRQLKEKGSLYPYLFDDTLRELGRYDKALVNRLVKKFREARPEIKLYNGARDILRKLKRTYRLSLITNGNVEMQKRKVELLGIAEIFEPIVYAQVHGAEEKPSVVPYLDALTRLCLKPWEVIYIGDNPYTDFSGARETGIATVRLLKGEFSRVMSSGQYGADYTIEELADLFVVLNRFDQRRQPA